MFSFVKLYGCVSERDVDEHTKKRKGIFGEIVETLTFHTVSSQRDKVGVRHEP